MDGYHHAKPPPGLKKPTMRGRGRLIVSPTGGNESFVEGAYLLFRAKKGKGDYPQEMDRPRFESWFSEVIHKLKPV